MSQVSDRYHVQRVEGLKKEAGELNVNEWMEMLLDNRAPRMNQEELDYLLHMLWVVFQSGQMKERYLQQQAEHAMRHGGTVADLPIDPGLPRQLPLW